MDNLPAASAAVAAAVAPGAAAVAPPAGKPRKPQQKQYYEEHGQYNDNDFYGGLLEKEHGIMSEGHEAVRLYGAAG